MKSEWDQSNGDEVISRAERIIAIVGPAKNCSFSSLTLSSRVFVTAGALGVTLGPKLTSRNPRGLAKAVFEDSELLTDGAFLKVPLRA